MNPETQLNLDVDVEDIGIIAKAARSFLRAQIAVENKDLDTIDEEIEWLSDHIYVNSLNIKDSGIATCAAGNSRYAPTENSVRIAQVIISQIEAMKAQLTGDQELFEAKMKKAVEIESLTGFPTGPPSIAKPSFEQYGEWLLANGRYEEAQKQFDKALLRMPRRSKSLEGKLASLKALKLQDEAEVVQGELLSIYSEADPEVRKLMED